MFGELERKDAGADATEALARELIRRSGRSTDSDTIAAGYTYLGQFIDHDITFDPTSQLGRANDPDALHDFRTPRLDLDSVYGSGPRDQPYLYDWGDDAHPGVKLLIGPVGRGPADLPRNAHGTALIGDPRNDENVIVSQLHLLFLKFHNRVVDHLAAQPLDGDALFEEAQRLVRWHYQWVVRHDFLPTVVGDALTFERGLFGADDRPFMPVEFSGAAFRFGHTMVREDYVLNDDSGAVPPFRLARGKRAGSQHLGGFRPLAQDLVIQWARFFDVPGEKNQVQMSMRLDTSLETVLKKVPPDGKALARLNLQRGRALGLPAGGDVAEALGVPRLTKAQLKLGAITDADARTALEEATPLWYYVLREAGTEGIGGRHLGPVGGRIVAEVLIGLLEADLSSYLRHYPDWRPELPGADGDFKIGDLITIAENGVPA